MVYRGIGRTIAADAMLTIFFVPKPFAGHIELIQRNAIRSWKRLDPRCQLILCGKEDGCLEIVSEFGLEHIPDVRRNELGTPLLSSVFERAEEGASHGLLCYINADIVLFPDFLEAVGRVAAARTPFLVIGENLRVDVATEIAGDDAFQELRRNAIADGNPRGPWALDFFVFPRGTIERLPDFAVGRPAWDNWMIWRARSSRIPVVDISPSAVVVHQQHEYGHVKQATGPTWQGPEADANAELLGAKELGFTLDDATHRLTETGLIRVHSGLMRTLQPELLLHRRTIPVYRILRAARRATRRAFARAASR
jgi:hypothetical protein